MATMAFDSPYEEPAAQKRVGPPISLHPAFPAIVALWFAALLGLGSLVLPAVLLEKAVSASGLASLVPAAAPPLGITARGLIALVAALVGAGLGVAIARRVASAHRPEPVSRVAKLAAGARRPISIHEELGGADGLPGVVNGESLPINRRRALAISEDDRPSDFLYRAPLPGDDPDAPAPFAAAPFVEAPADDDFAGDDALAGDDRADEPLDLSELAEEAAFPFAEPAAEPAQQADEDDEMSDSSEFTNAWPSHQHYPPEPANGDERDARNNLAGPRGPARLLRASRSSPLAGSGG